jgi:hypothetical protein
MWRNIDDVDDLFRDFSTTVWKLVILLTLIINKVFARFGVFGGGRGVLRSPKF